MMGVTSINTHPSESRHVWRDLRLGRSVKRNLNRGLLDGVAGGVDGDGDVDVDVDAGDIGTPMGRGN